jgi:hypothetical protein
MHLLDWGLPVWPTLNIHRSHCSGPQEYGRKQGNEKLLLVLDLFALFLAIIRYWPPAWLPSLFHTRFVLNDFGLFPKKARLKGQRFTTMKDIQKKCFRIWPHLTSLSLTVSGQQKEQENYLPPTRSEDPISSHLKNETFKIALTLGGTFEWLKISVTMLTHISPNPGFITQ